MTTSRDGSAADARRVLVRDATVKTVVVEIKTVTVSAKRFSLAVFRQLYQENIFDGSGGLAGVPWGWVNYCPGRGLCWVADDDEEHRSLQLEPTPHGHLVWQRGDALRRLSVPDQRSGRRRWFQFRGVSDERFDELCRSLDALEQLFIAV